MSNFERFTGGQASRTDPEMSFYKTGDARLNQPAVEQYFEDVDSASSTSRRSWRRTMSSEHDLLGKTVRSRQKYWYEVYESSREDADIHLVPVDSVLGQHISVDEFDERMADGWEVVYDGVTGDHDPAAEGDDVQDDDQPAAETAEDLGSTSAEDAESWISGGPR